MLLFKIQHTTFTNQRCEWYKSRLNENNDSKTNERERRAIGLLKFLDTEHRKHRKNKNKCRTGLIFFTRCDKSL